MSTDQGLQDRLTMVKRAVVEAFGNLPLPSEDALIKASRPHTGLPPEVAEREMVERERIRQELAGKRWQELDATFLQARWAALCYLSPTAWYYYLPALLSASLEHFSETNQLIHATVYSVLTPSAWALYFQGRDEGFEEQVTQFDERQFTVVRSFLELVFDYLPRWRHQSAQALKWGWNTPHNRVMEKVQEFYERLSHYEYPPSQDPQVRELIDQIRTAFSATPYPGDQQLCGSSQDDEPAEYALEFRGLDWRTLHPDLLELNYAALSFFTPEGFRYFLPAFLIHDLTVAGASADPVFHLTYGLCEGDREDLRTHGLDRYARFAPIERTAIVSYLKYRAASDRWDVEGVERIGQALEQYWLKQ